MKRKILVILTFALVLGLLIGCAGKNKNIKKQVKNNVNIKFYNKSGEKINKDLFSRFKQYWTLRKGVRPEDSYNFEVRNIMGVKYDNIYKFYIEKANNAKVKKIEIESVDESGLKWRDYDKICFTLKFYLLKKNKLGNKTFYQQDCWVNIDGEWFHLLNNPLLFKY